MDDTKVCPFCGEPIQKDARKCRWCGEWLDKESLSSSVRYITCPTCGEQIPEGSKICPLCKEAISVPDNKIHPPKAQAPSSTKKKYIPLYIIIGVVGIVVLLLGGLKLKSYLNDKEYQETIENSPYNIIRKNLDEAIAKGENLSWFLRDKKNVEALKKHFGDEQYSLMLALSFYSDEPLTACDPKDNVAGGYAWRTPTEKGKYGCKFCLSSDKLYCKYYYDGLEVDQFGNIITNPNWKCYYRKDDFNEDDTSRPYIEQMFYLNEDDSKFFTIRLDNEWGIYFKADTYSFSYFDKMLLRNNDTNEVWELPVDILGVSDAVLKREGWNKFLQWFQTAKSLTLSMTDSTGQYSPRTVTFRDEAMKYYATFMSHVMKKHFDSDIFVSNGLNKTN